METISFELTMIVLAAGVVLEFCCGAGTWPVRLSGLLLIVLVIVSLFWPVRVAMSPGQHSLLTTVSCILGVMAGVALILRGNRALRPPAD
jgi:hypothetical protein